MVSRDQLHAGDTVEGIGTGDGSGVEETADDRVLSGTQMQGLEALQGTVNAYFPQYGDAGARAVVVNSVSGTWDARRRRVSARTVLGASAFSLRSMDFGGDTSFQNLSEYIAWLVGILVPVLKGWDTSAVVTVGDSATALAWGMSGRFRSNNVFNAATVCAVLRGLNEINVVGSHRTTSVQNKVADVLSRRMVDEPWDNLTQRLGWRALHDMGMSGDLEGFEESRLRDWEGFLEMCNPRRECRSGLAAPEGRRSITSAHSLVGRLRLQ